MLPRRHVLFGTPLMLRLAMGATGREVYRAVGRRVARLLKPEARACLEACLVSQEAESGFAALRPPVPPMEEANAEVEGCPLNAQDAHAGKIPAFGFRLRQVTRNQRCWIYSMSM